MAKYVCTGHRLDLSMCGIGEPLTAGKVFELDPAIGQGLIEAGFPLSAFEEESISQGSGKGGE